MNKDRRATIQVCIELIRECAEIGEMSEASHTALGNALQQMVAGEYWSLRNMSKHEGKNESTDQQIAIAKVALPALEGAVQALAEEDYDKVLRLLRRAVKEDDRSKK